MVPYYLLVIIPYIVYSIGLIKGKKYDKLCISLFFVFLIILLSLRSINTGIDLANYKQYFSMISRVSFNSIRIFSTKGESLYFVLNKTVSMLNGNFQMLLFICAMLSMLPVYRYYYKKTDNALVTIALFLVVSPFSMFFSGLRQSIAMGIILFAFKYVENKKPFKYLLLVLFAFLFHKSSIFCIVLYPLYHTRITKNWLYIIIPSMILIFIFNEQIFNYLISFFALYDGKIESTGAYTMLVLLVLFGIYCFAFPDKNKIDKELIGLRNVLLLTITVQMFAPINTVIMRINYYFLLFIPILITKIKKASNEKNNKILNVISVIMVLFFTTYFFYKAYNGNNVLHIFPYIPFWEV